MPNNDKTILEDEQKSDVRMIEQTRAEITSKSNKTSDNDEKKTLSDLNESSAKTPESATFSSFAALKNKLADLTIDAFDAIMPQIAVPVTNPVTVRGYDFSASAQVDYDKLLFDSFLTTGIQASHFAQAIQRINEMIECKLKPIDLNAPGVTDMARMFPSLREQTKKMPTNDKTEDNDEEFFRTAFQRTNCTIFLGYTANMISSGVRESILFLVKHRMVDVLVTSAGGIEEDFMKCMRPAQMSEFEYDGARSRLDGHNRIGNMMVPNENYFQFEDWLSDILDKLLEEQNGDGGVNWTPSKFIARLGREIANEESVYFWAARHNIPVFCPAITDGAIGDCLFLHSLKHAPRPLRIDLVEDVQRLNLIPLFSVNTGAIILGGATPKHHVLNANCSRNGLSYAVFVNTAQSFDASDSGAMPNEAFSWGKIRPDAKPVKINGEASIIFPLLVAQTFAKNFPRRIE